MKPYAQWAPSGFDTRGLALPDRQGWLVVPTSRNRDSGCLDESNFAVAEKLLAAVDPEGEDHENHRFGHWACGWFEILIVRPGSKAAAEAEGIEAGLENYPVLDDEDFSEREQEAAQLTWTNCFNDRERLDYIRDHWSQFENCKAKWYPAQAAWRNLLDCVRGRVFFGCASELVQS